MLAYKTALWQKEKLYELFMKRAPKGDGTLHETKLREELWRAGYTKPSKLERRLSRKVIREQLRGIRAKQNHGLGEKLYKAGKHT